LITMPAIVVLPTPPLPASAIVVVIFSSSSFQIPSQIKPIWQFKQFVRPLITR
jgi:hypothetical protein